MDTCAPLKGRASEEMEVGGAHRIKSSENGSSFKKTHG
jgi:hypothetical protein